MSEPDAPRWNVRKSVEALKPGDRFIFDEEFGGEGEVVTATGPATNLMGTRVLTTEELDFDLEFATNAWVKIAVEEKP